MVNIKKEKEKRVKIRTHRAFISAPGPGLCTFQAPPHSSLGTAWCNSKERGTLKQIPPGHIPDRETWAPDSPLGLDIRTEPADLLYLQHDMNYPDQKPEKTITDIQEMLISWLISPDSECITFVQSLKWTQSNNKEHLEAMKKKEGDN